ncbi:hypothetical protein OLX02_12595 [Novosphingobium sp. KCTC 2891]|uniref:hypothetical protein n=1 Tax=Novosphingobium sp. KCTC 2891 TaxID=2989730 RepID=UPI0022229839|nr:hypothetical protein [Novosphingobium sp. KCTC 2891]MCW1383660.1 hypothetical protein [Novosphingobium sp. KCTC 2891]
MKPGARLKSAACDGEFVVIRAGGGTLTCGGAPLAETVAEAVPLDPAHAGGTVMGKRYVDAAGTVELLCVKPGQGALALGGVSLVLKEAKPLPASD